MDISDIKKHVGEKNYKEASQSAIKEGTEDVVHDIGTYIWWDNDKKINELEKLELTFKVYEEIPCYAVFVYIPKQDLNKESRKFLITQFIKYLNDKRKTHSEPVEYTLWCDFFEDPKLVEYYWTKIAKQQSLTPKALKRLLTISGPVPWSLKVSLYRKYLPNRRLHKWIYKGLLASAFDVYGEIDKDDAKNILKKLNLKSNEQFLKELEDKLKWWALIPSLWNKFRHKTL